MMRTSSTQQVLTGHLEFLNQHSQLETWYRHTEVLVLSSLSRKTYVHSAEQDERTG